MNRRDFIKKSAVGAFAIPSFGKAISNSSYEWWGLIALIKGFSGEKATGIPHIKQRLYEEITFSMGYGGVPCMIAPPCGPVGRTHIYEMIDPIILVEEYFAETAFMKILALQHQQRQAPNFLVLIGHSQGGNELINIVNSGRLTRKPDLIVTIDPFWIAGATTVSAGAARNAYNFYTSNASFGVHGYSIGGAKNYDYTDDICNVRGCFAGQGHQFTHMSIDDCDYIRDRIFRLVQGFFP